tara:strand:+ start:297 stop:434 length:138 start_codon:yes stop_codon:yes gene_type:complete
MKKSELSWMDSKGKTASQASAAERAYPPVFTTNGAKRFCRQASGS